MKVTWRKSATGEDEVKLVLIKHGLLDVDEGANFRCPIRQEVAVRNGERALEHPLRFRQMCSQKLVWKDYCFLECLTSHLVYFSQ